VLCYPPSSNSPAPGGASPASGGAAQWIEFVLGTTTAASATAIPAGSRILRRRLVVTAPYTAGATIALDNAAAVVIMAPGDNTPQLVNQYQAADRVVWPTAVAVRALVGGGPVGGAAIVMIEYVQSPQS